MTVADKPLAYNDLQVEEFVPERMKVQLVSKVEDALVGSKLSFDVAARYLFGGSALDSASSCRGDRADASRPSRTPISPTASRPREAGVARRRRAASSILRVDSRSRARARGEHDVHPDRRAHRDREVLEAGSGARRKTATRCTRRSTTSACARRRRAQRPARRSRSKAWSSTGPASKSDRAQAGADRARSSRGRLQLRLRRRERRVALRPLAARGAGRQSRREGRRRQVHVRRHARRRLAAASSCAKAGNARTDLVLDGEYSYDYYGYGDGNRSTRRRGPRSRRSSSSISPRSRSAKTVTAKIKTPYKGKVLWTVETDHVVTAEWRTSRPEASWSFKLASSRRTSTSARSSSRIRTSSRATRSCPIARTA